LPKLEAPSSLEVYEPEHKESIKTNLLGMQGSIEDTYTIVPQYQGNYPIPPLTFSYFDPVKETYVSLNSKEALIDVFEGPVANNPSLQGNLTKQVPLINENYFDFIKLETSLIPLEKVAFYRSSRFWILLCSPYLVYFIIAFLKRRNENKTIDPVTARQKYANRLAKKYLSSAKKALGEKELFYDALERALHNYLKAKLSIETSEFSKERIVGLLQEKNSQASSISAFVSILEKCEAARYAPSSNVTMQEDFDLAVQIIAALDREI